MLNVFTVSFFGHRYVDDFPSAEERTYDLICRLIRQKEYVDFLVGRDGEFDQIVSCAVVRAKSELFDGNSSHICVLPYIKSEYLNNRESFEKYYDEVEICEKSAVKYFKSAHQTRNRVMVDRSDLCVFYVKKQYGGALQTMQYALRRGKPVLNLAHTDLLTDR